MRYPSILLITGLILLLLAEFAGMAQIRVLAVLLLLTGAAGVGLLAGRQPSGSRAELAMVGLLRPAAGVIAIALMAPTLAVLAMSLLQILVPGIRLDSGAGHKWGAAGGGIALLLLAVAVLALGVAIRAMRTKASGPASGIAQ
jgi:hypothetical protein